jgi:hypothetical protein
MRTVSASALAKRAPKVDAAAAAAVFFNSDLREVAMVRSSPGYPVLRPVFVAFDGSSI